MGAPPLGSPTGSVAAHARGVVAEGAGDDGSSRLNSVGNVLVVLLVFGVALWRSAGGPQWRADLSAVRDIGLASTGLGGAVSTTLSQAFALLPLGSLWFRASLGAAVALATAALLLLVITRGVLAKLWPTASGPAAWMRSLVASISASAVALTPSWQQEGTVGGGASVAVALVLLCVVLLIELERPERGVLTPSGSRGWILLGAALAMTTAESLAAGIAALCVVGTSRLSARRKLPPRLRTASIAVFLGVLAALSALPIVRAAAPHGWAATVRVLSATDLSPLGLPGVRVNAVGVFARELGYVTFGLAVLGAVVGLSRRTSRATVAGLALLVPLHLVYPLDATGTLTADPLAAVRMAALAALGVCASIGVLWLLRFLLSLHVPFARPAAVLTVVFHATVVAVAVEEGGFVSDRSEHVAAQIWTREALESLPPRAAVLVRSPAIAWRLWAARVVGGQRPDVLVVPTSLVGQIPAVVHLLGAEPSSEPLLRDLAMTGTTSEFALSVLADARPLYVELDTRWDRKITSHLEVEGLWLRYAAQTLGPSDREPPKQPMLAPSSPLVRSIVEGTVRDDATVAVVTRTLKEQAAALSSLGLRDDASTAIDRLELLAADDPFATSARLRLAYAKTSRHRTVDLSDLLRF